ncbi:hypothetical protein [Bacillus solitudinis]|uniref:hypothetical protein n=1 Tax=Bacillus solitudinis TaxID=2014074 RepID=UPI000C23E16A|nr:hypothetical protein [Bacillus solitudinis]
MSKIIDLSLLTQEPLILKFAEDNMFSIASEPSVHLVNQLLDFEEKVIKAKTNKAQFGLFVKMVTLILSQDESKDVTEGFVEKNLSISQMKRVVEIYQEKVTENAESKN